MFFPARGITRKRSAVGDAALLPSAGRGAIRVPDLIAGATIDCMRNFHIAKALDLMTEWTARHTGLAR